MTAPDVPTLRSALGDLAAVLDRAHFELPTPDRDAATALVGETRWSIREYLLPRLADLDAPAVAVLVGSTGAGKSTVLNSLAGAEVTSPGAVRPTTRVPTVWTYAEHEDRYAADLMPSFRGEDRPLRLVTHDDPTFADLTIIDTPDVDSVVAEHRVVAEEVLAVADVCVFVTTAQRYADAVPWDILQGVRSRELPLVVVLNRVPPAGGEEIAADLRARLAAEGVGADHPLVRIPERSVVRDDGALPAASVAPLREELLRLSGPGRRREVLATAVAGATDHVIELSGALAEAIADERSEADRLLALAAEAYEQQAEELASAIEDGRLIRAEVLTRWQDFVGTGELVRALSQGAGRVRAWMRRVLGGVDDATGAVQGEARSQLADTIHRRTDRAAANAAGAWDASRTGRELLTGELWRADVATAERATDAVDDWFAELTELVEREGGGRRRVAQVASAGVNVVAVVLMLAVFSQTGGLTGAEVGITAGAAALQQRLLEHVFGSAAARTLIQRASGRLRETVGEVLAADRGRFDDLVHSRVVGADFAADLRVAVEAVAGARAAGVEGVRRG